MRTTQIVEKSMGSSGVVADENGGTSTLTSIVDALLPNRTDPTLDELGNTVFVDAGEDVAVSPVDQFLTALTPDSERCESRGRSRR